MGRASIYTPLRDAAFITLGHTGLGAIHVEIVLYEMLLGSRSVQPHSRTVASKQYLLGETFLGTSCGGQSLVEEIAGKDNG